ncbi:MAG TPA: arginine deiminase-related protein [Gemmatimonadota bacterium]|nr:arginine deiminase-related protein [Gemmatimonadota bacterium]
MIEPVGFGSNPETAADNAFQRPDGSEDADPSRAVESLAREESGRFGEILEAAGIEVFRFPARSDRSTPDAVFPNNWFSTHPDGRLVLYPMRATNRRLERDPDIVAFLRGRYAPVIDLTAAEERGLFLEGTGSLVIDEHARIVYASVSRRTSPELVRDWADRFDYRPIVFSARDAGGRAVYHTNVMLCLGASFAILCEAAIEEKLDRAAVSKALYESGREVIAISREQMGAFCANALELEDRSGERRLVISQRAWCSLMPDQRAVVERWTRPLTPNLETIETYGGGGARCMLAELW